LYLNTHSYYSLHYGTLSPELLVEKAKELGIKAFCMTDINNSSGMPDFVKLCNQNGIKPIGGIEFRNNNELLYFGIAKNNEGFKELNEAVTTRNLAAKPYYSVAPDFNNVYIVYPFASNFPDKLKDNEFIGVKPWEINKLLFSSKEIDKSKMLIQHPVTLIFL